MQRGCHPARTLGGGAHLDGFIQETDPPREGGDVEPGTRWRFYAITPPGREARQAEITRLESGVCGAAQRMKRVVYGSGFGRTFCHRIGSPVAGSTGDTQTGPQTI